MNRSPERWARVSAWFDELVELPAEERADRIAAIAADDPQGAAEVQALLDADASADDLLDAGLASALPGMAPDTDTDDVPDGSARIGIYRLLRLLGVGGMGAVYLAERSDGTYEQQVAIKLIKRGMDSMALMRRFLLERRILARLAHPHIVRLLDGGMSEDGRPYYVMEYVAGQSIVAHAAAKRLDIRQRVALLAQVAEAVAYAHAQLVVHRDLKPSNVLVDAGGEPRVLDFGIAKLIEDTGEATLTGTGVRVLSPAYAAPEQILGEPIGTATDVYALGLMLCELLTGQLPQRRVMAATAQSRDIGDATVERPSQLLERAGAAGASATYGSGSDAKGLAHMLRGDLDLIVQTALQREPQRRYPTAAAFADDLRRWLDDRPLLARADTAWYRLRSFVRRHRLGVAAGVLVLLSLLGGLGAALWQAREARLQAELAQQQSARAERVKSFLISIFQQNDPSRTKGNALSAADILRRGRAGLDAALLDDPQTRAELLVAIAQIQGNLGEAEDGTATIELAVPLLEENLPSDDPRLGMALFLRARFYTEVDRLEEAEREMRRSRSILALDRDHPDRLDAVERELAYVLNRTDTPQAAIALSRSVLERMSQRLPDASPALAEHRLNLALLLEDAGDYPAAEAEYERGLPVLLNAWGTLSPPVCEAQKNHAGLLDRIGKPEASLAQMQSALDCHRQLFGSHSLTYAETRFSHGILLLGLQRHAEAEADFRATLAVFDPVSNDAAHSQRYLGRALFEQGRYAEAAERYREAEAVYRRVDLPNDSQRWRARADQGYALFRNGNAAAGRIAVDAALTGLKETLPIDDASEFMRPLRALGEIAISQDQFETALYAQRRWKAIAIARLGAGSREDCEASLHLARSLAKQGARTRLDEARMLIDQALAQARAAAHPNLASYEQAQREITAALARLPSG